ncbi:MAG: type I-C CRISPR-associated protein Cas7/Csd2 [Streptosporangiaceae bacterium]
MTTTQTRAATAAHLDAERKQDFVFHFDVRDGNPNGDPDAGGMPRTDPETQQGLVTDVAIKRKLRNMVTLLSEGKPGYDIYVEAGVALNAQHKRAYSALGLKPGEGKNKPSPADQAAAQRWMCETFYDVRMFGAVMSTGNAPCGRVQGPAQISFSRSVSPVLSQEHGLTRVTQTREEDIAKGETTEMGSKHAIPYGLYVGYGHLSAPLAARTGVTSEDLETLWRAFTLMLEHDRASTRGEMTLRGLYVFTHADRFGSAPAQALFDRITVTPAGQQPPRSYADYTVGLPEVGDLPAGVVLTRVCG